MRDWNPNDGADLAEQPVEEVDSIEVYDILLRQVTEGVDIGDLEADANQSRLPRSRGSVEVHDGSAGNQETTVDTRLPENEVGTAHRTAFSAPAVQTQSEEVGRHRPACRAGGSNKGIDFGKRLRDFLGRKAVAQPLTSDNQVAIQPI